MAIIVNLVGFAHAQNDILPDAPKQIRFYANQLKSNFEKIKTLKGKLSSSFRRSVDAAVFYHDRGNQLGIEETSVAGDFIKEDSEAYTFIWDLGSNNLVSLGVPTDKPCRYLDAKTNEEVTPEKNNGLIGVERKTVINSEFEIFTSITNRTEDGQHQIYERSQNITHEMRGSPKAIFFWAADLTYHEFLFAVAKQLQEEGESAGVCHLSIDKDLHTLELIAKSKTTGDPLIYKWIFDASCDFALTMYENRINEKNHVTTHEWTYSSSEAEVPLPTKLVTTIVDKENGSRQEMHELSNMVVNDELPDDVFSLATLEPVNGDFLLDKESGETFVIQDLGNKLTSTDLSKVTSSTNTRLFFVAINIAVVVILFALVIKRRRTNA